MFVSCRGMLYLFVKFKNAKVSEHRWETNEASDGTCTLRSVAASSGLLWAAPAGTLLALGCRGLLAQPSNATRAAATVIQR